MQIIHRNVSSTAFQLKIRSGTCKWKPFPSVNPADLQICCNIEQIRSTRSIDLKQNIASKTLRSIKRQQYVSRSAPIKLEEKNLTWKYILLQIGTVSHQTTSKDPISTAKNTDSKEEEEKLDSGHWKHRRRCYWPWSKCSSKATDIEERR